MDETMAFDVVKESGHAAAAAGAAFGVVIGSFVPVPVLGPTLGAAIGFGIGMAVGRAFASRERSTAPVHVDHAIPVEYIFAHDD